MSDRKPAPDEPWRFACPDCESVALVEELCSTLDEERYWCNRCYWYGPPAELRDKKATAKNPTEAATPISEDPALEDVDDQTRRGVVALFDLKQTHLGGE